MIHWSKNKTHLVVYHGTHINNVQNILDNGISNRDPNTGMVSVAIGDRGKQVAHAYAGMASAGGEHNFRQVGQRPVSVPHEDRAVVVAHLPMHWVRRHIDKNFGGNSDAVKERLRNPEAHDAYVNKSDKDKKSGEDTSGRETMEHRYDAPIEAKYIVGYSQMGVFTQTQREEKMKTFREFMEDTGGVPTNNAGSGSIANPNITKLFTPRRKSYSELAKKKIRETPGAA